MEGSLAQLRKKKSSQTTTEEWKDSESNNSLCDIRRLEAV